jgi:DNA invertase Pin-like site-specific DNA recombinase
MIDSVIVRDLSRLSHDYWLLDELVSFFTAHDVLLITVAEGVLINGADSPATLLERPSSEFI